MVGLLGLLIVMGIVLYMMFGTGGGKASYMDTVKKTRDDGRELAREIKTDQMSLLIAMYRQANNKLPTKVADLEAPPGSFNDRFGTEMTFTFVDQGGRTMIKYKSAGPDRQHGTPDDVEHTDSVPY